MTDAGDTRPGGWVPSRFECEEAEARARDFVRSHARHVRLTDRAPTIRRRSDEVRFWMLITACQIAASVGLLAVIVWQSWVR